jgi:AraC-like DNA-binding protein
MFEVTINRRQTHFHSDFELLLCLEGSVTVDAGDSRAILEQGEFFLVNRNEAHSLRRTDRPNALLVLQFSPNFSKAYYPKLSSIRITGRHITKSAQPLCGELTNCFRELVEIFHKREEGYQLALTGVLNRAAYCVIRFAKYEECAKGDPPTGDRDAARLTRIIDYIQKNFMYPISLGTIARQENLELTYLSHYIKERLGISFRDYVNRLRLEQAAWLILNSDLRMIDICVECGYSDYRYLNKAFLSGFGCTPAQFKKAGSASGLAVPSKFIQRSREHTILEIGGEYERLISCFSKIAI